MSKIYDYEDLKESKLYFEKKPPRYSIIIFFLMILLLVLIAIFSMFALKTTNIYGPGFITSMEKANVMNKISGQIVKVNVSNGQAIYQGDILMEFDNTSILLDIEHLEETISYHEKRIQNIDIFIGFLRSINLETVHYAEIPFILDDINQQRLYLESQSMLDYVIDQIMTFEDTETPYTQKDIDKLITNLISQQLSILESINQTILGYSRQLEVYNKTQQNHFVTAVIDGIFYESFPILEGTVLPSGTLIGTIVQLENNIIIEAYISASDRVQINLDDEVSINVMGIESISIEKVYGVVVHIDFNPVILSNGLSAYKIYVSIVDNNENKIMDSMLFGIPVEVKITHSDSTWFKWIIEQVRGKQ